ncbi:hypothetical protein AYO44_08550 [Planctomycetaceae bacterium SCGC AG-212-F19]|nr:hypothetical protein AYO44_08550 [Planctomycetaceae bacterium SCGC AG-212-F19]
MIGIFDTFQARMNRREVLRAGALGTLGLSLPQLLQAESGVRKSRIKSCIMIFAFGGPAQQETFDMKPDAPEEIRGEFKPITTNVAGIQICEHLPKLAKLADQYAIIRSATHKNRVHNPGSFYALTGRKPSADVVQFPAKRDDWPALGSILAKVRPVERALPPYVLLPVFANDIGIPTPGQHAGFLGTGLDPLIVNSDPNKANFSVPALTPRAELTADRLDSRRGLLAQVNTQVEMLSQTTAGQSLDRSYERAFDLVSSAVSKQAFDISKEAGTVRDRYGRNRHGQSVLLARRLVEAGVRLVLVQDAEENGQNKVWDTHGDGFKTMRKHLPETDSALASLLEDLRERGLLDSTLVVWMGEFGRSPRVDKGGGRDHWPDVYSLVLAGGGIKGGQVFGSSDARAAFPRENPVGPEEIHATIYHALGLPEHTMIHDTIGRPLPLYHGKPIYGLF